MAKKIKVEEKKGIPISLSLNPVLEAENMYSLRRFKGKRILYLSFLAFVSAVFVGFVAKALVLLINLLTNISFYGNFSFENTTPVGHEVGVFVILVPAIGGLIVGLIAYYGSAAIRGHGIPEAMEQILTNESKIKPSIIFLKPLSSAISIGTGGPFGAEGPIIATGGALGSSLGQILKITANERKILLTAGATAGMAAIFGSPLAAIFLAIELLLFEFSPRSIIPVAIACITGAVGHFLYFHSGPVFPSPDILPPTAITLFLYSLLGAAMGLVAAAVTRLVYFVEDSFEKLPLHWMWWPAIGGLGVGVIGYYAPSTMGVGYDNIINILSGSLSLKVLLVLCFLKFLSWVIALGSGTSGGTLAPLFTVGGAGGALMGLCVQYFYPEAEISLPVCALVGMAAMFAGASRALLTSIVFALETTMQANALLPLLAGCTASYLISFFFLKNTIMTEKIARRGVKTPDSYVPDLLEKTEVKQVYDRNAIVLNAKSTIGETRQWLRTLANDQTKNYFVTVDNDENILGVVSVLDIYNLKNEENQLLQSLITKKPMTIYEDNLLQIAVDIMTKENIDLLPVVSRKNKQNVLGVLDYKDILQVFSLKSGELDKLKRSISLKRRGIKTIVQGKSFLKDKRIKRRY